MRPALKEAPARPWAIVLAVAAVTVALGWQFITDSSRAVPAFDTAFYQWRAEFLLHESPGGLIELRGATGALAGGYRVAEPVLGAMLRTVGGVAASTHTILLSVLFRVLAAAGMAAFAWKHRRSLLLFYVTLVSIPALFLLQQFFGYLDNFMTAALIAGVLVLWDRVRQSWGARIAVTAMLFLAGMSHPTTLIIFLLSVGAVAAYRLIRERSLLAPLQSEGPIVLAGTVAVALTAAFWLGGLWGPTSSFSDAAVPPPETVDFFVNRSVGVLKNLEPFYPVLILFPLIAVGLVIEVARMLRRRHDTFAEVLVAWTLPLLGMLGFAVGAAYPYFRFFNATLAPLSLAAVAITAIVLWALRIRRRPWRPVIPIVAVAGAALILGVWWQRGLAEWNADTNVEQRAWLTPHIRETVAAARGYLNLQPEDRTVIFVTDAQPGEIVPYGHYKEHANAIYAGLPGERIANTTLFFGRIEDLREGRASTSSDAPYNEISAETADQVRPLLERDDVLVFAPAVFNEHSTNAVALENCGQGSGALACEPVGDSGLFLLPDLTTAPVSEEALLAGADAARDARAFVAAPPGPLDDLARTLLTLIRLALLLLLPGWLFYRRLPNPSWPEGMALVPLLSIAGITTVGMLAMAILRSPFTPAVGWISWGITVGVAAVARLPAAVRRRRDAVFAAPARLIDDTAKLFRRKEFTRLMGAQWLAQAADGLVGVALAKLITFGGQAGFNLDVEAARSPREALLVVLLTFLPYTLFSPFVGVLIDRWDRRRLLIGANGLRAVLLGLILILGLSRVGDAALYISFLLILAGTRLLLAIKGAGLPTVLGGRDLLQGNSISQAGSALFQLFGAAVALVASGILSTAVVLIGGVVVYGLGAVSARGTGRLGTARRITPLRQEVGRLLRDVMEGIREVAHRGAASLALLSFFVVRSLLTFVVLATVFVSREFIAEQGALTTAIPGAAGALGAAVGFVVAHVLRDRVAPARIVSIALLLGGAGVVAFGGIINLVGISLTAFSVGVGFFLGKVGVDTMMQEALADAFRGRGFSLQDIVYNLSWIIPSFTLFLLLTPETAQVLLRVAGAVFLAMAVGIAVLARRVQADTKPSPRPRRARAGAR
ncbi:MAG TPA: MFS transporter [Actinomycetota bacterium]|nr:MFS transporter [Actinomycetota bacterium]